MAAPAWDPNHASSLDETGLRSRHHDHGARAQWVKSQPQQLDDPFNRNGQCRICLESGGADLISPCRCKGSMEFVHRSCLDQWRATKPNGNAFLFCPTCNFEYVMEIEDDAESDKRRRCKYCLYVFRDVLFLLLITQILIAACGAIGYGIDHGAENDSWRATLADKGVGAVGAYYILGVLMMLLVIGLLGCCLGCCCSARYSTSMDWGCWLCMFNMGDCLRASGRGVGGSSRSDDDGKAVLLFLLLILILIGFAIAIVFFVVFLDRSMRAHRATIWKKQLTTKYRVMDLHGRAIPPDDLAAAGAGAGGAAAAAFDNNLYYHQHAQPLAHPDQHVVSIDYHPLGAAGGAGGSGSVNNGGAGVGIVPSAPLPPSYDDSMGSHSNAKTGSDSYMT